MVNSRDLSALRSDVRVNVETLLAVCRAQGMNVLITQTLRDDEYQAYLYAQGRTRPGAIITNSRVTTFHGKGLAVDFCRNVKGHEYDDAAFFRKVASIAKQIGFSWGGDWKSFVDMPHLQWDDHGKYTTAMLKSGAIAPRMPKYKEDNPMEKERYNTMQEISDRVPWATETVQGLIDKEIIRGGGLKDTQGRPADMDLSRDMLRLLVINDRAGLYG